MHGDIDRILTDFPGPLSFEDVTEFHYRFGCIRLFQDGNERAGRPALFEQALSNQIMPFVLLDEDTGLHYRGLSEYPEEPGYLRDTFRNSQDQHAQRFETLVSPLMTPAEPLNDPSHV